MQPTMDGLIVLQYDILVAGLFRREVHYYITIALPHGIFIYLVFKLREFSQVRLQDVKEEKRNTVTVISLVLRVPFQKKVISEQDLEIKL